MEDASALVDRINASTLKDEYSWLAANIISIERSNAIKKQSDRLKALKRGCEAAPTQSVGTNEP